MVGLQDSNSCVPTATPPRIDPADAHIREVRLLFEWDYLITSLAQIVVVVFVVCFLAVTIKSTYNTLRKKDK